MAPVKVGPILGSSTHPSVTQTSAATALDQLGASRRPNAVWIQGLASTRSRQCHRVIPSQTQARLSVQMVANASDRQLRAAQILSVSRQPNAVRIQGSASKRSLLSHRVIPYQVQGTRPSAVMVANASDQQLRAAQILSVSRRPNAVRIQGSASKRSLQCHRAIPYQVQARPSAEMVANASDQRFRAAAAQILRRAGNPAVQER